MAGRGGKRSTSFKPGQSGNPRGRVKIPDDIKEAARAHTPEALQTLASIMKDGAAPPAARVSAAQTLLDRAWGKAPQQIDMNLKGSFAEFIASLGMGTSTPALRGVENEPGEVRH